MKRSKTAISTALYNDRRKAAGLMQAKIWVHPDDLTEVREYAMSKSTTQAAIAESKHFKPAVEL